MKIETMLIAVVAVVSSCGSPGSVDAPVDRVANVARAPEGSTSAMTTIEQLEANLNACSAEAGCREQSILKALWTRGYCRTSSGGTIGKCTPREIADDRRTTAEFGR